MLLIILFSALVIGAIIAVKTKKKQPKQFETNLDYTHEELAPEATPEPSIVEAITTPVVEKKKKKPATKKPAVKMDAKKKSNKK